MGFENGKTLRADENTGASWWSEYSGKHYVENIGNTKVLIVYTEIKVLE